MRCLAFPLAIGLIGACSTFTSEPTPAAGPGSDAGTGSDGGVDPVMGVGVPDDAQAADGHRTDGNPGALPFSGWWRGKFSGSPWTPTNSAGISLANGALAETTNPPAAGTAQNGFTPAAFDGTNDELSSKNLLSAFVNAGSGSALVLFRASAASPAAPAGEPFEDPGLLVQSGGGTTWGINYSTAGVRLGLYDGTWKELAINAPTGSYHLAQVKWDGTTLKLRVDSSPWSSILAGNCDPTAADGRLAVGRNYSSTRFFSGSVLELMLTNTVFDDVTFDNLKAYLNTRYALSL